MPNRRTIPQIWRHAGGEGGYKYLDDMTDKEIAEQAAVHRSYDRIAAADAAHNQKSAERYEQQQREEQAKKFDLTLRIGVFFDGTGNNVSNAENGQRCGAHHPIAPEDLASSCMFYMSDPESSYGNDPSNISRLYDLYEVPEKLTGTGPDKAALLRLYIEGIGTKAGAKDSVYVLATGRGETGVEGRVEYAFKEILKWMNSLNELHPDAEIRAMIFDIFGFSRGAAAARHFANQLASGPQGPMGNVLNQTKAKFSRFFMPDTYDIRTGFVGLFDTVASIAGLSNLGNYSSHRTPGLKLYLDPKSFPHVVQLAARDEKRFNFALNEVAPDHLEITLPGVHSNIGGGYLPLSEEQLMVTPMQSLEVALDQDVTETAIYRDAVAAKERLVNEGWPADKLMVVTPVEKRLSADPRDRMAPARKRVYAGLYISRHVRGELSRVYLRVMHALAKAKQVPFNDIPAKPEYQIPDELQPLCDRFVAGDYSITPAENALLRRHYIHTSAHWNHPLGKDEGGGLALIYLNSPMEDGVRVRHPHVPR